MKENRIPFDVKFRKDIEAGRYRVETRDGRPARIICWDAHNRFFIIVLVSDEYDFENIYKYVGNGCFYGQTTDEDTDLFLVPVEQDAFPSLRLEDEPIEVELTIKRKEESK